MLFIIIILIFITNIYTDDIKIDNNLTEEINQETNTNQIDKINNENTENNKANINNNTNIQNNNNETNINNALNKESKINTKIQLQNNNKLNTKRHKKHVQTNHNKKTTNPNANLQHINKKSKFFFKNSKLTKRSCAILTTIIVILIAIAIAIPILKSRKNTKMRTSPENHEQSKSDIIDDNKNIIIFESNDCKIYNNSCHSVHLLIKQNKLTLILGNEYSFDLRSDELNYQSGTQIYNFENITRNQIYKKQTSYEILNFSDTNCKKINYNIKTKEYAAYYQLLDDEKAIQLQADLTFNEFITKSFQDLNGNSEEIFKDMEGLRNKVNDSKEILNNIQKEFTL